MKSKTKTKQKQKQGSNVSRDLYPCPETFTRLADLLRERDGVEEALENLLDDVDSFGAPLDPKRDIEPEYHRLSLVVADINRALFTIYVEFLPSEESVSDATATSSSRATHSRPSVPVMGPVRKSAPLPVTSNDPKKVLRLMRNTLQTAPERETSLRLLGSELESNPPRTFIAPTLSSFRNLTHNPYLTPDLPLRSISQEDDSSSRTITTTVKPYPFQQTYSV
jgi:hypothetical protein